MQAERLPLPFRNGMMSERCGLPPGALAHASPLFHCPVIATGYFFMNFSEQASKGVDKIARYKWQLKDKPGTLCWIHKSNIVIDLTYQRALIKQRVIDLSAAWSWVACGTLIITLRMDKYFAIDGQHRLMAAQRRSDIEQLPCLLFETKSIQEEAKGFLNVNSQRKPISTAHRHKAMVVSGDPVATCVQETIDQLGLSTTTDSKTPGHFGCLSWALNAAREDQEVFKTVLSVASKISLDDAEPIHLTLLSGLTYINKHYAPGILEPRMQARILHKRALSLHVAAKKSAILNNGGGAKIWAKGIVDELNKGIPKKFKVRGIND